MRSGVLKKQGTFFWSERFLVLYRGTLLVYRNPVRASCHSIGHEFNTPGQTLNQTVTDAI